MNEAFCMALAGRMGLAVPEVAIRGGSETVLVVRRFDRERGPDGAVIRIHQEDFCQALGFLPEQKYESEGGPALSRCFDLVNRSSIRPAADRMALLQWVIFNVLIGNADAHAKNLTILLAAPGPRLAPFYDLLCTTVYEDLADRLAMKIGGENRLDWLQTRHWASLADALSIKPGLVLRRLAEMTKSIVPETEELAAEFRNRYGEAGILESICAAIRKRARTMS
jgi:serine/threonine-protein kinase HipA